MFKKESKCGFQLAKMQKKRWGWVSMEVWGGASGWILRNWLRSVLGTWAAAPIRAPTAEHWGLACSLVQQQACPTREHKRRASSSQLAASPWHPPPPDSSTQRAGVYLFAHAWGLWRLWGPTELLWVPSGYEFLCQRKQRVACPFSAGASSASAY